MVCGPKLPLACRCHLSTLPIPPLQLLRAAALYPPPQTEDTKRYAEVINRIGGRAGAAYALDREWMNRVERQASNKQDKLESGGCCAVLCCVLRLMPAVLHLVYAVLCCAVPCRA